MKEHVEGTFEVTSWTEAPAEGLEGTVKVTVAAAVSLAGVVDLATAEASGVRRRW